LARQLRRAHRCRFQRKDVWSDAYNPLSLRADIGRLTGASFLRPRRVLVGGLAPVLTSYLKQLRLPVEVGPADPASAPVAPEGALPTDTSVGLVAGLSDAERDAFKVVDRALARECHTFEVDFWWFLIFRLQLRVQLLLTDIPWNTRRVAGNDNSDHDVFNDGDRGVLCDYVTSSVRQGGHAIIMCSFSQFPDLSKALESFTCLSKCPGFCGEKDTV